VRLKVELQSAVQHGSKGMLGSVTVYTVDSSGNESAPSKDCEVTLRPTAMCPSNPSLSAKVAASGSNRARLVSGRATFKDVQLASDAHGVFELAAYCRSRAVVRYTLKVCCSMQRHLLHTLWRRATAPSEKLLLHTSVSVPHRPPR
jgi:hypothetical protein